MQCWYVQPGPAAARSAVAGRAPDWRNTLLGTLAELTRRVVNSDSEPGVLDLTPLRELLSELVEEPGGHDGEAGRPGDNTWPHQADRDGCHPKAIF
jgi:hypothetical protein